ncbi:two-component system sensor histidine kinase DesK [Friedmanniella endophytica]|uniref:Two-component system sensor histidine kinase DesK n=1 Tax=Microlunatus kandeliicorticis TaxID=1759536 RepID=A0A7W3IVY8_9ACTN|nr:histidine kinase [Microlunatus kandeliicorticis]MBA8796209.1 two-component system sensor histidine kinase DesK [Microlunatus kandeliicorticis]
MSTAAGPPAGGLPGVPLGTSARRFETYTRLSLYVLLGFELFFSVGLLAGAVRDDASLWLLFVLTVAQTGLGIAVCRWALGAMRAARRRPEGRTRWLFLAWGLVTLASWAAAVLLPVDDRAADLVVRLVAVAPFCAVAPVLGRRGMLLAGAGCVLVTAALLVPVLVDVRGWGYLVGIMVGWSFGIFAIGFSFWASGWMLRVVWALDAARGQAASLAIAEERLRISRDLHDVFGRTLTAVAVKSELSAELARRGRPEQAADEMAAVRRIADEAAREVRQVVSGVRHADLTTELAGARSLLDSAGVRCRVTGGPPDGLHPAAAAALAWTLREAVTNVIRHSRATWCDVELGGTDPVLLRIRNDGAAPDPAAPVDAGGRGGHGLVGIAERLAAVGGRVRHGWTDGGVVFALEAAVPLGPTGWVPVGPDRLGGVRPGEPVGAGRNEERAR